MFQSTHPYRVWQASYWCKDGLSKFQSTHPYRVWPQEGGFQRGQRYVLIHTPIQGVTLSPQALRESERCFNPHTHTGCDRTDGDRPHRRRVSIHTPIQGVTWLKRYQMFISVFQSTHPYRVWLNARMFSRTMPMFQSTHPYRVWHSIAGQQQVQHQFQSTHPYRVWLGDPVFVHAAENSFNPHTHTGCDFRFSLWY